MKYVKYPTRIISSLIVVLLIWSPIALCDLEDIKTGISGTADTDIISNIQPLDINAILQTTSDEDVTTNVRGINSLAGNDKVTAMANIAANASSTINVSYVPIRLGETASRSTSNGITGSDGDDTLLNLASIFQTSTAYTEFTGVVMQIDLGVSGWPTTSKSLSLGLEGGDGVDDVTNHGIISLFADSDTLVKQAQISAVELPLEMSVFGDGKTTATSIGIGMIGDMHTGTFDKTPGFPEVISNSGALSVSSTANSTTEQGMVELLGAARVDDSTIADSYVAGILGGVNDSHITNYGTIHVAASSTADMTSVELKMKGLMLKAFFDLIGLDVGTFETPADSVAVGIAGNTGNDTIINTGSAGVSMIDVYGKADADSEVYTFSISPPLGGGGSSGGPAAGAVMLAGLSLADLSAANTVYGTASGGSSNAYGNAGTVASSNTFGMIGAEGNDTLINNVGLKSRAEASATNLTLSVDVGLSKTSFIPLPGAAVADASTTAISISSGIDGGTGDDIINNTSNINASATADANSLGIAATLKGSMEGLSAGVSVVDASSTAMTAARGIVGGTGGDTITNSGVVTSNATSRDDSTSVSVSLAGNEVGVSAGVTMADAIGRASAYSFGIDGENAGGDETTSTASQSDVITNTGEIRSTAGATTDANSVGVSVAGSLKGVSVSVALAETDVVSEAHATGIRTGIGEDTIKNEASGIIDAVATAASASNSVSVAVSAGWTGVAMGASFAEANTQAAAGAVGIESGGANDTITNSAQVNASSTANVASKSIAVTAAVAPKGFSAGVAFSETETNSAAGAVGIDAGEGDDTVTNSSRITTSSLASTKTETIAINFAEAGAAVADVSSDANAASTGIAGSKGVDKLTNSGTIVSTAVSVSDDTNASANFAGYASGDIESTSTAAAIGMSGGDGTDGETSGDTLINSSGGTITSVATANAYADNYVIQGGGVQFAKVGSKTDSLAVSIAGGALGDTLDNEGTLISVAQSEIKASNFDFSLFGVQVGSVGINGVGTAIGIDGGDGANKITNGLGAAINTYADLSNTSLNTAASIGAQFIRSGATAHANSFGITGGADLDRIDNLGTINATANSLGEAGGGTFGIASMTLVDALASADIIGIHSGSGGDVIENNGTINAGAFQTGDNFLSRANTTAVAADFITFVSTSLGARANVTGINGAAGNDTITNNGTIFIGEPDITDACTQDRGMVIGRSFGFGGQLLGASFAYAGSSARSTSIGIDGGAGNDLLVNNNGAITTKARSYSDVDCETFIPLGLFDSRAQAESFSTALATGMYGGDGWDTMINRGTMTVDALTIADAASDAEVDLAAEPHAESEAEATARSVGMDGGAAGSKVFRNYGTIGTKSNAGARPYAYSESDFMRTEATGYGLAESTAYGITSGNVFCTVTNYDTGIINVSALAGTYDTLGNIGTSRSDEDSTIDAGYYKASTKRWTPLSAKAYGIELGSDNDVVLNDGSITVSSGANGSVYAYSNTYTRYPFSTARSVVLGQAQGIGAGRGWNRVTNNGTLTVNAVSHAAPSGYAWSRDYQATVNVYGDSDAVAVGMKVDGIMTNSSTGALDVTARATSWATANTNSEFANAKALVDATATGFAFYSDTGRAELQSITNDGTATVRALAGEDELGSSHQIAWVNTNITTRDSTADCNGISTVDAAGVRVGDGLKQITNNGTLTVLGRARADLTTASGAHTYARSYYYNPAAISYAEGIAAATGILATGGENTVTNTGIMDITAETRDVYAWSDSYSSWSTCYSTALASSTTMGKGISVGAGNDIIRNDGSLKVTSSGVAHSYAYADTRDNNLADEYETSHAATTATALGIDGGGGNNTIENTGDLIVSADALAWVNYGGGHASVTATTTSTASAKGIIVGDDGSVIHNTGTIDVQARAGYINGWPTLGVSTVGILGGDGDDLIVNDGEINTSMASGMWIGGDMVSGIPVTGTGIDAGDGSDIVILGDGSTVIGAVLLGPGDDTLVLRGNPIVNGSLLTMGGTNTVILENAGYFGHHLSGFSNALKQGDGLYTVSSLNSVASLAVEKGILEINSDYQFSASGSLQTALNPDGNCGQLKIVGTGDLDGRLIVSQEQGLYKEGKTYDVVTANALTGSFSEAHLPESKPLLAYSLDQTSDCVKVSVIPRSCASVTSNNTERVIGDYLDRIIPAATGALSNMLGVFQTQSANEFGASFTSLGPAVHHSATETTFEVSSEYNQTLIKRMHSMRSLIESNNSSLAYSQRDTHAAWIDGFGHWANQESETGIPGYDYYLAGAALGADRLLTDSFLAGISYGQSNADIDTAHDMGDSNIESYFGSLYGSYSTDQMYLDTTLSYGRQSYDSVRTVTVGATRQKAHSDHYGDVYSAYIEAGRNFTLKNWTFQPFAALSYTLLDEESYNESGAPGVNLRVSERKTDSLVSDLGLRFTCPFKRGTWLCIPEASVAWDHDFDLDDRSIKTAFEGSPTMTFIADGRDVDKDGVAVGAGLTLINKKNVNVSIRYAGEFRNNYEAHSLTGGIRYEF